jgi:hypothetical protein
MVQKIKAQHCQNTEIKKNLRQQNPCCHVLLLLLLRTPPLADITNC